MGSSIPAYLSWFLARGLEGSNKAKKDEISLIGWGGGEQDLLKGLKHEATPGSKC